jgi:hypothetical protein
VKRIGVAVALSLSHPRIERPTPQSHGFLLIILTTSLYFRAFLNMFSHH